MIKMTKNKYRKTMIITSLLILLPAAMGLLLYQRLPVRMATHFGLNDMPNGFSSKPWVILGLPLLTLLLQFFIFYLLKHESRTQALNVKVVNITLWIIPVMINVISFTIYTFALGYHMRSSLILNLLFGIFFIILGNYLPKTTPNQVVGIRLPWTMANARNWQKTHRLAGWTLIIGGLILLVTAFMRIPWLFIVILLVSILAPIAYSYWLSKIKD